VLKKNQALGCLKLKEYGTFNVGEKIQNFGSFKTRNPKKAKNRHKEKTKHEVFNDQMKKFVCDGLETHFSPKQIRGRAVVEKLPCVSHERIYQFICPYASTRILSGTRHTMR